MTGPAPTTARDAWERVAAGFDDHTTPHTIELGRQVVDRLGVGPGDRVLDVAAGSGALALPAARAGAEVVAVDVAPTMVRRLRRRAAAEGLDLAAEVGDGTALDLGDGAVDVTMSLNGISVFDDLPAGLREALRVTRSGGKVAVATFGPLPQVEFVAFLLGAVRTVAGDAVRLPPGPLPPFRLAEPDVLRTTLEGAGLAAVAIDELAWATAFASADEYLDVVRVSNPIAGRLLAGLDDDRRAEVRDVLAGMLRERSGGDGPAVLRSRVLLGHGTV